MRQFYLSRYFFKYFPVYDIGFLLTSSGVPHATTVPPPLPPSGPYLSRYFFKYFPVYDIGFLLTSSGVPHATTVPPPLPPSGPRSII